MHVSADKYGHRVTGASAPTLDALNRFGDAWLEYGPDVGVIFAAADDDPDCALVQAYAGLLHMALEAETGYRAARPFLERASMNAASATPREQAIIAAALDWAQGNFPSALQEFERVAECAPDDIVAAKWGQYLAFNLGDAGAMLRLAQSIIPQHRKTAEAWGMLAFGQEQMYHLDKAEESSRMALSLNPEEAWAQHALAHVFETRGQVDEGIDFLTQASPGWTDRSIFMREHNYWHLALFHLDRDEPETALKIFDQCLWGEWPEFAQEQIGAVSMLWRLELRGAQIGSRWQPVIEKILERGHEHIWPFHDLHYVYALSRAETGKAAAEFLSSIDRMAADRGGVWADVAAPAARAVNAHATGRHHEAAETLAPILNDLHTIGGSHAQRDIFVQTWIDAALHANQHSAVEHVLQSRAHARPRIKAHHRDIERCKGTAAKHSQRH